MYFGSIFLDSQSGGDKERGRKGERQTGRQGDREGGYELNGMGWDGMNLEIQTVDEQIRCSSSILYRTNS